MAHLAALIDADPDRRRQFTTAVRTLFTALPETTTSDAQAGQLACVWATGPRAPVSLHREGDRFAVLIGYAVDDAGRWVTARDLADAWLDDDPAGHDGYHVAVASDPIRGLAAGVDPLGLFPLYHAALPTGGLMVATTPAAFGCHPDFIRRIDRVGLAGILLAHGLLDDRSLLAGAQRLPSAHRLRARPGQAATTQQIFDPAAIEQHEGEFFADSCRRVEGELLAALRRHRPADDDTLLMLSGGLDSRLVAGCLADAGIPTRAVTFGRPQDYEVRAATAVAEATGMPLERICTERDDSSFTHQAREAVRFNYLSSAPGGDDFAAGLHQAATRSRFLWSGIPFDWVFEPISLHNGYDAATGTWSFDGLLTHVNAWGVPLETLPALLGPDGAALCREVLGRLEACCVNGPLPPERQSSLLRWDQRVRNHLGAAVHRTSFLSWPLMPATDRRFFAAAFGAPQSASANRRIEKEILVRRRPDLAAIPLDTNSFRFEPLLTAPTRGLGGATAALVGKLRRIVHSIRPRSDPRRYERLFNVDQPRWQHLRQAAERHRPQLEAHLDAATLARVLPPPARRLRSRTPLKHGSPIRLLAGLALLLDDDGLPAATGHRHDPAT